MMNIYQLYVNMIDYIIDIYEKDDNLKELKLIYEKS
jgi:hypothetical protein